MFPFFLAGWGKRGATVTWAALDRGLVILRMVSISRRLPLAMGVGGNVERWLCNVPTIRICYNMFSFTGWLSCGVCFWRRRAERSSSAADWAYVNIAGQYSVLPVHHTYLLTAMYLDPDADERERFKNPAELGAGPTFCSH